MFFKRRSKLDDVIIAAPCPVKWEQMQGDERVRFCASCEKNVFNISELTRNEAELFLKQRAGNLGCLRLFRRADGTIITKDCPVGRRMADAFNRRARIAVAALLAVLNSMPALAQALKLPAELNRVDAPRDINGSPMPIIYEERGFSTGREREQKKSPTLPESEQVSQQEPREGERQKMYTVARDAYFKAKRLDFEKNHAEAAKSYEDALSAIRNSKFGCDPKFAKLIGDDYARFLRKRGETKKAASVEDELCKRTVTENSVSESSRAARDCSNAKEVGSLSTDVPKVESTDSGTTSSGK